MKSKRKIKTPNSQLSTLNHTHDTAPQRDSSTHHTPLPTPCFFFLILIHGSNKSENQKRKKTNSTLNSQPHPRQGIAARITPPSITPKSTFLIFTFIRIGFGSACPERMGCCHGPTQARGRYAHWARTHLHREVLREVSRCRHAALDRMLHRPTETYAGDPEHCRELDDSPDEPGVANAWDSSAERGAFGGAPSRGA